MKQTINCRDFDTLKSYLEQIRPKIRRNQRWKQKAAAKAKHAFGTPSRFNDRKVSVAAEYAPGDCVRFPQPNRTDKRTREAMVQPLSACPAATA